MTYARRSGVKWLKLAELGQSTQQPSPQIGDKPERKKPAEAGFHPITVDQ
jgi:hypothetical protein